MDDLRARIAQICAACLERHAVAFDDNLIRLGADSLVAVNIVAQIEKEFGVETVDTFFESPTVESLAAAVEQHRAALR